jgi:hypothetical protein
MAITPDNAITPDDKDWTWVLQRACPECGFDTTLVTGEVIPGLIRENAAAWVSLLREHPDARSRPADDRWSALEYACHVRDVFELFATRLALMLAENDPTFPNWDQDATAVADLYGSQDAVVVAAGLETAAVALADRIDGLDKDAWGRTGTRSDGARFTVETFTRYLIHDPVHHLHDVRAGG